MIYILLGTIFLGIALLVYMLWIEPYRLKKRHYLIQKNKQSVLDISKAYDLYEKQTNITIAHISDTHFSRFYKPRRFNNVIRSILRNSPDIIVFTGDLIDDYKNWPTRQTKALIDKLKRLPAPMGKIAILGNHDYRSDGEFFVAAVLKEAGFTLLKNEQVFGANENISVTISGVDDCLKGKPEFTFERTLAEWHIMLIHEPDSVQNVEHVVDYDLILAGHSHGRQVRLPFVRYKHPGAIKFQRGLYLLTKKTLLSVSSGIGTTIIPMRFRVPPEITYYHLAKEDEETVE